MYELHVDSCNQIHYLYNMCKALVSLMPRLYICSADVDGTSLRHLNLSDKFYPLAPLRRFPSLGKLSFQVYVMAFRAHWEQEMGFIQLNPSISSLATAAALALNHSARD